MNYYVMAQFTFLIYIFKFLLIHSTRNSDQSFDYRLKTFFDM